MGYILNDAIIVTGHMKDLVTARDKALELGLRCTEAVQHAINGKESFLIVPDGSKEGWSESVAGHLAREAWKTWAKASGLYLEWIHVQYAGDDSQDNKIVDVS